MAVEKLAITSRRPAGGGRTFGKVGSYDYIQGTASFAVDPQHPANRCITDVDLAPRGTGGLVRFSANFSILKPTDPRRGSHKLLLGVPNRSNKVALGFNYAQRGPEPEEGPDLGDGFLMRHGYTVVECGWEWGMPAGRGQMTIDLPEATGLEGPLCGKVMLEWQPNQQRACIPLSEGSIGGLGSYPVADLNDAEASLTVRDHQMAPRHPIDRRLWQFAKVADGRVVPDPAHVYLSTGFQMGKIYEIVYHTQAAPVIGLGLLAIRDIASFLRHASEDEGNPCAGNIDYAYAYGISQTGRFLRHFLYLGLNQDEAERMVFDGILAHIAGNRRGQFNQRFGVPSTLSIFGPENLFPYADAEQTDLLIGKADGLLSRCMRQGKVPKVFYTNSSAEYWTAGASLTHTDLQGTRDVSPPESVRTYLLASTQHGPGSWPLTNVSLRGDRLRHALNSLDYWPLLRAALANLDNWVSKGVEPPPSRYPRLADGSAVLPASLERTYSSIPGVSLPKHVPQAPRLDFGPQWSEAVATTLPPEIGAAYTSFVSAVDEDGNEIAGIRLPDLAAPLATYTGWNRRHPESGGADEVTRLMGATLPFPHTAAERKASGDPRRSIEERYGSKSEYLRLLQQAASDLVAARYLLGEDVERVVQGAAQRYDYFTSARYAG